MPCLTFLVASFPGFLHFLFSHKYAQHHDCKGWLDGLCTTQWQRAKFIHSHCRCACLLPHVVKRPEKVLGKEGYLDKASFILGFCKLFLQSWHFSFPPITHLENSLTSFMSLFKDTYSRPTLTTLFNMQPALPQHIHIPEETPKPALFFRSICSLLTCYIICISIIFTVHCLSPTLEYKLHREKDFSLFYSCMYSEYVE